MRYFAVFLPMKDEELSKLKRDDHLAFMEEAENKGQIIMKGRFTDGAGGLIIYQGNSLEEVEAIAKQDPYVIHGARGFEIHEWAMTTTKF